MKKYFFITAFLVACSFVAVCQSPNRLLQLLPSLKDSARVDCLNELAAIYGYMGKAKSDSVHYYKSLAYKEATRLGYKSGIAKGLMGLKAETDSIRIENIRKAIRLGEEINDNGVLGWAYYNLIPQPSGKKDKESNLELMKKSIYYFQKAGDVLREAEITNWLCMEYSGAEKEEGFDYCQRSVQLSKQIRSSVKDWEDWGQYLFNFSLMSMSSLYEQGGDYTTAMDFLRQARLSAKESNRGWGMEDVMSQLFIKMGQYDSSLYYLQILTKTDKRPFVNFLFGKTYFLKGDYESALLKFQLAVDSTRNTTKYVSLMKALLGMAQVYEVKKNYNDALKNLSEGLAISQRFTDRQYRMDAYELLSKLHHQLGKNDSAYHYLQLYTGLKDSTSNKQFLWKLNMKLYEYKRAAADARNESQLALLGKDVKIKEQQLKQQAMAKNFIIAVFIAFVLIGVFVYRNLRLKRKNEMMRREKAEDELKVQQLESEKKQSELKQQAAELEMQALRAQMNPHFIFNCLSSINKFILKNETEAASDYLTRFSRLIRMVLINSQKSLITLEDELEMLRLYLDMERLRFINSFEYNIHFKNTVDAGAIYLPPLLLQPFCENAIWHGLMHKEGQGVLDIAMTMQDNILNCTITDNGVGREMAAELNSKSAEKEKSLGLKITAGRLELLNRNNGAQTSYTIEDLYDEKRNAAGTKVTVQIKYKNSVEEFISN